MAKEGQVGRLWKKHGGGYYALWAVGTFIWLEVANFTGAIASADGVGDFIMSESVSFFIDMILNSLFASLWPVYWYGRAGMSVVYWAVGGYLAWTLLLAFALDRREKEMRKELGLD